MEIARSSKQGFTGVTSIFVYSSSQDDRPIFKVKKRIESCKFQ